ncbi:MAG: hypothetical protein OEY63_05355 [Gemmatimonadota bacterium]|nr:hypothetical protein [Gemmatimonadota bacterium]
MQELDAVHLMTNLPEANVLHHLAVPLEQTVPANFRDALVLARATIRQHANVWMDIAVHPTIIPDLSKIVLSNDITLKTTGGAVQFKKAAVELTAVAGISLGGSIDDLIRERWAMGKPDEAMALHATSAAAVEFFRDKLKDLIRENNDDLNPLPHYSPGYPGWPLTDQANLLAALPGTTHPITVMDSGGLRPSYSTLFIVGLGRTATFSTNDDIWTAHSRSTQPSSSIPVKTLEKWAKHRLTVSEPSDGISTARFRFDGNTCTNLGQTMTFEYTLSFKRHASGTFIVQGTSVAPVPGTEGYLRSCAFKNNPAMFHNQLATDSPSVDKTTQEALDEYIFASPSACLCNSDFRKHKWRLFLETLHFALVSDGTTT